MFRRLIALQLISNGLLLAIGNLVGLYYQYMTMAGRQRTVERTRSCVESRVRLECEKEHQEQLLLSVIPAYIAAEVSRNRERGSHILVSSRCKYRVAMQWWFATSICVDLK